MMFRSARPPATTRRPRSRPALTLLAGLFALILLAGCGAPSQSPAAGAAGQKAPGSAGDRVLRIGAIPDQDVSVLNRQFGGVADYLSTKLGVTVKYVPSADYAALVQGFRRGEIHLAWFGGLTGVQAQAIAPGTVAFAQRPRDAQFHSVFIAQPGLPVQGLKDLKGLSFSFGSESSTSGHLMPRFFMLEAGIDPDKDLKGAPTFSGSHDKTIKLVESGAVQAGALNEQVWQSRRKENQVDTGKVQVFYTTPEYYDYHWSMGPELDKAFGTGFSDQLRQAILDMGPGEKALLELFGTDQFVATKNENYRAIRDVAEKLGILR